VKFKIVARDGRHYEVLGFVIGHDPERGMLVVTASDTAAIGVERPQPANERKVIPVGADGFERTGFNT